MTDTATLTFNQIGSETEAVNKQTTSAQPRPGLQCKSAIKGEKTLANLTTAIRPTNSTLTSCRRPWQREFAATYRALWAG